MEFLGVIFGIYSTTNGFQFIVGPKTAILRPDALCCFLFHRKERCGVKISQGDGVCSDICDIYYI